MTREHLALLLTLFLWTWGCSYPKRHSIETNRHTAPFAYLITDNGETRLVIARAQRDTLFIVPDVDSFSWLPNGFIVGHHNETQRTVLIDQANIIRELRKSDFEIIDYNRSNQALLLQDNTQSGSNGFAYGEIADDQIRILRRFGGKSFPTGSGFQDPYSCGKDQVCLYMIPADSQTSVFSILDAKNQKVKKLKNLESIEQSKSAFINGKITFFDIEDGNLTLKAYDNSGVSMDKPLSVQRVLKTDMQNVLSLDSNAEGTAILAEFMQGDKSTGLYFFDVVRNQMRPVTGSWGLGHFEHTPRFYKP